MMRILCLMALILRLEELGQGKDFCRINEAEFSSRLSTALQIGFINLSKYWGTSPAAVIGHSSGEIPAGYSSNAITAKSAIIIAYYGGHVSKKQIRSGQIVETGLAPWVP